MPRHKGRRAAEVALVFEEPPTVSASTYNLYAQRSHHAPHRQRISQSVMKHVFLVQHFQFVLRPDLLGEHRPQGMVQAKRHVMEKLHMSDSLVPWDAVHSVIMRAAPDSFECRICFEYPVAPRITECGHLFCLPCLLQYVRYQKEHNKPRTCPVCQYPLVTTMLRPCVLHPVRCLEPGVQARFALFKRQQDSVIVYRYDDPQVVEWGQGAKKNSTSSQTEQLTLPRCMTSYGIQSRYVWATASYEHNQYHLDVAGISERLRAMASTPRPLTEFDYGVELSLTDAFDEVTRDCANVSSASSTDSPLPALVPAHGCGGGLAADDKVVEFYAEDEDGQPFYLHMLTVKMLRHDAKLRNANIPKEVCAKIDEIIPFTQSESLRLEHRAFSHIPLHGTINLCILDLHGVVLPETISAFHTALENRSAQRSLRQRNDSSVTEDDSSWRHYVQKYSAQTPLLPDFRRSSSVSHEVDSASFVPLPSVSSAWSDHGLPPNTLDTRQRATKKQEVKPLRSHSQEGGLTSPTFATSSAASPRHTVNCWENGGVRRLLAIAYPSPSTAASSTDSQHCHACSSTPFANNGDGGGKI